PGVQVYVIVRGDTLWDLAKRFYTDPYLWPQLWEKNKYIQDAHWIYPGDPLVLGPEVTPGSTQAAASTPSGEETPVTTPGGRRPEEPMPAPEVNGVLSSGAAAGAPTPLGSESDIYCSGYIGETNEQYQFSITGSEYEVMSPTLGVTRNNVSGVYGPVSTVKYDLSTGDIVYLDGGRAQGLQAGNLFSVVAADRAVTDPVRGGVVGRFNRYLGRVRVLSVQDSTAIGEIVQACDPILTGARLRAFEPEPVPLGRPTAMRPVNLPAPAEKLRDAPVIVYSRDDIVSLGQDHVVFIDRGSEQDVVPGDVFTIYRQNRPGLPPVVLGELAVLSVQKRFSTAKIIASRYPIYIGDRLDPK
ncbi:MAG TPA: LysM peptidoglycan-binding domain-containing protein, partial [Thermoanaerobaculia bacterium]